MAHTYARMPLPAIYAAVLDTAPSTSACAFGSRLQIQRRALRQSECLESDPSFARGQPASRQGCAGTI